MHAIFYCVAILVLQYHVHTLQLVRDTSHTTLHTGHMHIIISDDQPGTKLF